MRRFGLPGYRRISGLAVLSLLLLALVAPARPWAPLQAGQAEPAASEELIATFSAMADATVRQGQPDTNFGSADTLTLGYSAIEGSDEAALLIAFDLSSLPHDAVVTWAEMRLYLSDGSGVTSLTTILYSVLGPWQEDTVTWNTLPPTSDLGELSTSLDMSWGYKGWDVTASAQAWVTGENHGLLLRPFHEGRLCERVFRSREAAVVQPYLVVSYHLPELSGRVYSGEVGDERLPMSGVAVDLYASNSARTLGDRVATTATDRTGWYSLTAPAGYEYYTIVEVDPPGYESVGATTVDGLAINPNAIQYTYPLAGKTLTGNKFWDRPIPTATPTLSDRITATPTSAVRPTATPTNTPAPPPAQPDLVVPDLWEEAGRICLQVRNVGDEVAAAGHLAALMVDGAVAATTSVGVDLVPRESWRGCFEYAWACTPGDHSIVGWADYGGIVAESDETNNRRQEVWPCDATPPVITTGPTVSGVTQTSAVISWETDEEADSLVRYGRVPRVYEGEQSDATLTTAHAVTLTGLEPAATYHYRASSTDAAGNSVSSADLTFQTLPEADGGDRWVRLVDPGTITTTTTLRAEVSDERGIAKVEFHVDGRLVHTDYSPPYEWTLISDEWENGDYTLEIKAFDLVARVCSDIKIFTVLAFVDTTRPTVRIYHPPVDWQVSGKTPVYAIIEDDAGWSEVAWYADGVKIGSGQYPTSPKLDWKIWWDTRWLPNGPHTFAVTVTDQTGKTGSDSVRVQVMNEEPPPQPKLVITQHELYRHGNVFALELTVQNKGQATASGIQIRDALVGFQPVTQSKDGYTVEGDLAVTGMVNTCLIKDSLNLAVGGWRKYVLTLLPVLVHPNPPAVSVGNSIQIDYTGAYGAKLQETTKYVLSATTAVPYQQASEPLAISHANAVKAANYLIVTNPGRLAALNPGQDIDVVLSDMARLAQLRNGALGYLRVTDRTVLRNLVRPGGDWAVRMHPDFVATSKGYLLLVGETEVVPAWLENRWNIGWNNWACRTFEVDNSDLPYADTGGSDAAPELVVGRIIGNTLGDLSAALRASIDNKTFDRSHALLISGRDSSSPSLQAAFVQRIDDLEKLLKDAWSVAKLHFSQLAAGQEEAQFRNNTSGRDLVVFAGHGSPDTWCAIDTDEVTGNPWAVPPIPAPSFGTTNPVVLAWSCLTGSYEDHTANAQVLPPPSFGNCTYDGGDDNIAEAFLDRGAAVYIGAAEVSPSTQNGEAGKAFLEKWWGPNTTVGKALTDLKRDRWSSNGFWQLWVYEYNLYGDPKYGAAPSGGSILVAPEVAEGQTAEPLAALDVAIPAYVVTAVDGLDEVTIPGGGQVLEAGRHRIPYYRVALEYGVGHEVQAVSLVGRSDPTTATGLHLPVHEDLIDARPAGSAPALASETGWIPQETYDWVARKNADGTTTLLITMYPFSYNPLTTEARFYPGYSFDIAYTVSAVTITDLTTDRDTYAQGDAVHVQTSLLNPAEPQDVRFSAVIKDYPMGTVIAGLPMETLVGLGGAAAFSTQWDSAGTAPGHYTVEVTVQDLADNVLDRHSALFRLGAPAATVTRLAATPSRFRVGDTIAIAAEVQNTGTLSLDGLAVIRVHDESGAVVREFEHPVVGVAPGEAVALDDSWDTSGQEDGTYTVVAFVLYDGMASEPSTASVSTRMHLYLPSVSKER